MKPIVIAMGVVTACAALAQAGERSPAEIERYAQTLLMRAYQRLDVRAFCFDNPDSVYPVEMGGKGETVMLTVRCRSYHDWLASNEPRVESR